MRDDLSLGLRSVAVFTILFAAGIGTLATPSLQFFVPSLSLAEATAAGPILTVLAVGIIFQGIWFTTQRVMLAYADTKRLLLAFLNAVAYLQTTLSPTDLLALTQQIERELGRTVKSENHAYHDRPIDIEIGRAHV